MAILTSDIKLLKSAVMSDTTYGGGPMTGLVVVDGQSNSVYPDTSEIDRAYGRVQIRKLFGVAHTDNVDTLLGSHAIITDAPNDPLVSVSMFQTPGWGDIRSAAADVIQRYLVKGPRYPCRLLDTHYAGTKLVNLVGVSDTDFPSVGDAVVFRKPDTTEQYVRVTQSRLSDQSFNVLGGVAKVRKCVIELATPLVADQPGQQLSLVEESSSDVYSFLYQTSPAVGASFYSIAPLTAAVSVGASSVMVPSLFVPLVPASTIETPIVDQYPLTVRTSLSKTASAYLTYSESTTASAGSVIQLPTAIEPSTLTITMGGSLMSDDGAGTLKFGTLEVGTVVYLTGQVTLGTLVATTSSRTITYRPASIAGAACYSAYRDITVGNQGLSFVEALTPAPAPATYTLSYMAQGRWYDLRDNGNGKLAGNDTAYGVGTVNYLTGSVSVTFGAVPDIGSPIIHTWGDSFAAIAASTVGTLPTRLGTNIALPANLKPGSLSMSWGRENTVYTAALSAAGVLSGNATGKIVEGVLVFEPAVIPIANVTLSYKLLPTPGTVTFTGSGSNVTLTGAPVEPGSVRIRLALELPAYPTGFPTSAYVKDDGLGNILREADNVVCGAINYTTGAVTLPTSFYSQGSPSLHVSGDWSSPTYVWLRQYTSPQPVSSILEALYRGTSAGTIATQTVSAMTWQLRVPTYTGSTMLTANLALKIESSVYFTSAGGGASLISLSTLASGGSVAPTGEITLLPEALPSAGNNVVSWINVAVDASLRRAGGGVFRTATAPIKTGVMQIQSGVRVGSANAGGIISGGLFSGTVDFARGVVKWGVTNPASDFVDPIALSYNAVFLQYLPLNASLLGLDTTRLPLDGRVPFVRVGDIAVIHNTLTTLINNPAVLATTYSLGRARIASVKVVDSLGVTVAPDRYTTDLNLGTVTFIASLSAYAQPLTVHHRVEDMAPVGAVDVSGKVSLTRALTQTYPAATSFLSTALVFGDLQARSFNQFEQASFTDVWSDIAIGSTIVANYNEVISPIAVTNKGAIRERWLLLFTSSSEFRIIGQSVGQIGTGSINTTTAPINPATNVPYFTLYAAGWGTGWAVGNGMRHNTEACGAPIHLARTILQGPATLSSDAFTLAFRGDVNA